MHRGHVSARLEASVSQYTRLHDELRMDDHHENNAMLCKEMKGGVCELRLPCLEKTARAALCKQWS